MSDRVDDPSRLVGALEIKQLSHHRSPGDVLSPSSAASTGSNGLLEVAPCSSMEGSNIGGLVGPRTCLVANAKDGSKASGLVGLGCCLAIHMMYVSNGGRLVGPSTFLAA